MFSNSGERWWAVRAESKNEESVRQVSVGAKKTTYVYRQDRGALMTIRYTQWAWNAAAIESKPREREEGVTGEGDRRWIAKATSGCHHWWRLARVRVRERCERDQPKEATMPRSEGVKKDRRQEHSEECGALTQQQNEWKPGAEVFQEQQPKNFNFYYCSTVVFSSH